MEAKVTQKVSPSEKLAAYDEKLRKKHGPVIIGVDEAGRGAWAGPISAGAAILPAGTKLAGLNDSKKMTHETRAALAVEIKKVALGWGYCEIGPEEIDDRGLTWANGEAMVRAAKAALEMAGVPDVHLYVLDQFNQRHLSPAADLAPWVMASKMDGTSLSVAAASVIAKTTRDALLAGELHAQHPHYCLDVNKGYVRPEHVEAVKVHGRVKGLHRMSYMVEGVNKPKQFSVLDLLAVEDENKETEEE